MSRESVRSSILGAALVAACVVALPARPARAGSLLETIGRAFDAHLRPPNVEATFRVKADDADLEAVAAVLEGRVRAVDGAVHERTLTPPHTITLRMRLEYPDGDEIGALARSYRVTLSEALDVAADEALRALRDEGVALPAGVRLVQGWTTPDGRPRLTAASADEKALRAFLAAHPFEGGAWVLEPPSPPGRRDWRALLAAPPALSSDRFERSEARRDPMGHWSVAVELDDEGREAFAALTERTVRHRVAIVIDGVVDSAPVVQEPIRGGRLMISLGAAENPELAAHDLARYLAVPLPSPVELQSVTTLGR